jgi:hypothetical protein
MRLARIAQTLNNGDRGSARVDRENALRAGNSQKIKSLEELVGDSGGGRYTLDRRIINAQLDETYYMSIDNLNKKKE